MTSGFVICLECGGRNRRGEDFCGECGAYLAWEAPPEDASAATRGEVPIEKGPAPAPDRAADAEPEEVAAADPGPTDPSVAARSIVEPAETSTPALRKPTAPAAHRRPPAAAPTPEEPPPSADDIVCPACGAGNRPERRFCRRCAAQLTAIASGVASTQPIAGSRPRGRSTRFPFAAVVVLLVLAMLLVVAWFNRDAVIGFVETIVGFVFSPQSP